MNEKAQKPPQGVFPQSQFVEVERDLLLLKARRAAALRRHLWEEKGDEHVCAACGMCFTTFGDDDALERARDSHCTPRKARNVMRAEDILARWPALTAHLICESLGYATPTTAAHIIESYLRGKQNWCEWIAACYGCDPVPPIRSCIRTRHHHKGYMAEFKQALGLVMTKLATDHEPTFASWF